MGILEKMGITPGPWKITGAYGHLIAPENSENPRDIICESWERVIGNRVKSETFNLIAAAPEMLEALIEYELDDRTIYAEGYSPAVGIIEKATGKTWEEIKELIK